MKMNYQQLISRRKELRREIQQERKSHYEAMFMLVNELFEVEKNLNPKYTIKQLAKDNDLHEVWLYRLMSWNKATIYVKQKVEVGDIGMAKACRLISRVPVFKQDELLDFVIKNKLTDDEMDKYATKYGALKQKMIAQREYKNKWNIVRDISHYCMKMERCLLAVKNIPVRQRELTYQNLKRLKRIIENTIGVLKPEVMKK